MVNGLLIDEVIGLLNWTLWYKLSMYFSAIIRWIESVFYKS